MLLKKGKSCFKAVDGNLKVNKAANNDFDPKAATTFHTFLQTHKIPSMVFDRNAATNLKYIAPRLQPKKAQKVTTGIGIKKGLDGQRTSLNLRRSTSSDHSPISLHMMH